MADRSRYAEVAAAIRQDIVAGVFSFGKRLKIAELAARYGTSHTPIREALKMLSGDDLVDMQPNRGVRIRAIDAAYVSNLFDIRIQLEGMQARLAAERRTDEELAELREARLRFETYAAQKDVPALLEANLRFHEVISKASRNREAADIEKRHWRILPALWTAHGYPEERLLIVMDDHRLLEHLIAERDGEGANILGSSHCLRAKLHILKVAFGKNSTQPGSSPSRLNGTVAHRCDKDIPLLGTQHVSPVA